MSSRTGTSGYFSRHVRSVSARFWRASADTFARSAWCAAVSLTPWLPNGAGAKCQAWTATRVAPRSAASSNANGRVAVASCGSRMPTTTSRCTTPVSSLATTTGQEASMAAYLLTEPSSIAANPPAPRAPTTSSSAPEPLPVTISAGGPVSKSVSMSRSGATSPARVMASARARRGVSPSIFATPAGAGLDAHMRGGMAGADTSRSGAPCRFASLAAHSTARSDSSEPSTPTTTGLVVMTILLARIQWLFPQAVPCELCLQLAADKDGQVSHSGRVAPLVVVPAEHLDQRPGRLGKRCVEDAGRGVADDVAGDDRVRAVAQNARQG